MLKHTARSAPLQDAGVELWVIGLCGLARLRSPALTARAERDIESEHADPHLPLRQRDIAVGAALGLRLHHYRGVGDRDALAFPLAKI